MKPGKNTLSGFNTYYAGFYKYVNYWVALTQTKTEVYDQLDPGNEEKKNTSIVSYSFVRPGQSVASPDLFVRKITNELPGSIKMVTENRYVTDFSPNTAYVNFLDEGTKGIYRLQQQQVQSELIETLSYKELIDNGSVVLQPLSGTVNIFKQFVSTPGQETVYLSEVKTFKPLVNSVVSAPMSYLDFGTAYELGSPVQKDNLIFRHSSQYKTTLKIDSYDNYGNPLSMTSADGVVKTMSWVNNNSLLGTLTSNAGPNQHQTTYQHKPMVGLTKAIDANGREIKYAFDAFSRLTTIRDHDNYIQTNYRYYLPGESLEMLSSAINVTGCKMRNQPINFNGGVGTQYGATTYEWNFGDGTSATNTTGTINHTYALTGVYTVSVKRTNPEYFGETTNTIQVVVDQPVASASLCADGIISYDVCNAVQPTTSQCQGGPPIQSRVTQTQPIRKRLPITKGLNVVGVQNPTLSVQTAGGSVTGFEWQYSINGGPWTPFGYGGRSVVGPPGYGDGISRGFAVRCIVTDTCGNSVTSDTLYLSAYASSQCF